jgi:hypothetical protein
MRPIEFEGTTTRVLAAGGKAWFVARDVMVVAGYPAARRVTGVFERVPDKDKGFGVAPSSGSRRMMLVSYSGLLRFLSVTEEKWPHGDGGSKLKYILMARACDGIAAGGTTGSVEPFSPADAR